ncbi:MAG: glutamine-hydrolyzing GMP synthase [Chloroflexi bacterium]|nr:glutamine-hydrolyzing GMP synthase [Chloroflexota bacterium]
MGSQTTQLIARRIRELNVYCELISYKTKWDEIKNLNPRGFILSGGPNSVYDENAPLPPAYVYESGLPVLGICYGMQSIAHQLGGVVSPSNEREYGHAVLILTEEQSSLFKNVDTTTPVWMSHGDKITKMPPDFKSLAYTENTPIAAMGLNNKIFGIQFHPEVMHTAQGKQMLKNFVYDICHCNGTWTMDNFIKESIAKIKEQVGSGRVLSAISGGVDSSVVSTLIHRAIGNQLTCVFVNNGLLRKEEAERTIKVFREKLGIKVNYVDASERFLSAIKGVTDPEQKRKIIGHTFIEVFEEESKKLGEVDFLAQGTLYPDVIESVSSVSNISSVIKTHHNVGGLPKYMKFKLLEPMRYLFKDEVRKLGSELGLEEDLVWRQPFPGPGLAIRCIGEVTKERLDILRNADWVVMDEIKKAKLYREMWQTFAVLTDTKSVGVMGDFRTYSYALAIRAVTSSDAMTADWARLPYDLLAKISNRIVNEVRGINRIVYDITSKPPGTIEWE